MIAAIIVGVLVVVGGGVAAALLLLGGDDDGSSGDGGALDTAQAYVEAIRDGDCGAAEELSTDQLKEQTPCEDGILPPDNFDVEISDPEITDESDTEATATIAVKVSGGDIGETELDVTLGLVNQDGEWLVDTFGSGSEPPTDGPTSAPSSGPTIPSFSIPSFSIPSFSIPSFTIPSS